MPAGGALFGSSASGPGSTGGNKHLVEMRAGKMYMKGIIKKKQKLLARYVTPFIILQAVWYILTNARVSFMYTKVKIRLCTFVGKIAPLVIHC